MYSNSLKKNKAKTNEVQACLSESMALVLVLYLPAWVQLAVLEAELCREWGELFWVSKKTVGKLVALLDDLMFAITPWKTLFLKLSALCASAFDVTAPHSSVPTVKTDLKYPNWCQAWKEQYFLLFTLQLLLLR